MFTSAGDQVDDARFVVTTGDGELGLFVGVIEHGYNEDDCNDLMSDALAKVEP